MVNILNTWFKIIEYDHQLEKCKSIKETERNSMLIKSNLLGLSKKRVFNQVLNNADENLRYRICNIQINGNLLNLRERKTNGVSLATVIVMMTSICDTFQSITFVICNFYHF